jgi:hypothetical protein
MNERIIIPFPKRRIANTVRTISELINRIRGVPSEIVVTDQNQEPLIDFKSRWEARRRPQMLKELERSWAWSRRTGFGTNPNGAYDVVEKVVDDGSTWTIVRNLDPMYKKHRIRGKSRWEIDAEQPQLTLITS